MPNFANNQLYVVLISLVFGFTLGFVYDLLSFSGYLLGIKTIVTKSRVEKRFEIINKKKKINKVFLFFWDVLYFIIITPMCAIFLYGVSEGIVRWYIILSMLVGYVIYRATLGIFINKVFRIIALICRYAFKKLFEVVYKRVKGCSKFTKRKKKIVTHKNELFNYGIRK